MGSPALTTTVKTVGPWALPDGASREALADAARTALGLAPGARPDAEPVIADTPEAGGATEE